MSMHNSFGDNIAGNKIIYSLSENECDPVEIDNQYPQNDKLIPDLQELLKTLEENKIVFISGELSDKKQIARQLALQLKTSKNKNNFSAFELFSSCAGGIPFTERIRKKSAIGCFVLQGMQPENLVDCYDDFKLSKNEDLYFIVTTDEPRLLWAFSDNFNDAWREVNDEDIYSDEQLKAFAVYELKKLEQAEKLIYWEIPRLCRGDVHSLTYPEVHPDTLKREPPSTCKGESEWTSLKA